MNKLKISLHRIFGPESIAILAKIVGFSVFFWLLIQGLQLVPSSIYGGGAAPIIAGITTVAILALIFRLLRVEGESPQDVGLGLTSKSLPHFFLGTGLGLVVVAAMLSALLLLTPLEIESSGDGNVVAVLVMSLLILLVLALMEEVAFRSYSLFKLRQVWGIRPAIYFTSIAFAFYHGLALENLLGPGVWGLFFGWMAFSTNSIALPTGFHLGLNWLQALVGMKPQYSASIWEFSIGSSTGMMDLETLGFIIQAILFVVGILLVENLVRQQNQNS